MKKILSLCGIGLFAGIFCLWSFVGAGELDPAGAPAPTMKTLEEVEPRIPIGPNTTPGHPGISIGSASPAVIT